MTEIEIRGKLAKEKFNELFKLLTSDGKLVDHYHRLSIDLSPGFDETTKTWKNSSGTDIRLKKSDDREKLSVKMGSFHDKERKEIEVKLQTGQFLNALDFLEALGYNSGMIYYWESWEFKYQGVEVKLSRYNDHYFTFEIEGKENSNVESVAKKFELTPYSKEEYRKTIDWENRNIHQLYTRKLNEKLLKSKFSSKQDFFIDINTTG
jgi:pterin-4a-carbinolamine dehydratase